MKMNLQSLQNSRTTFSQSMIFFTYSQIIGEENQNVLCKDVMKHAFNLSVSF